jgi:hypothetical protein
MEIGAGVLFRRAALGLLGCVLVLVALPALAGFGERYCDRDGFRCVTVERGDRWETLFPDPVHRDLVKRLNRRNLQPRPGQRIAVPADPGATDPLDLAPFAKTIAPPGLSRLVIDQSELAWAAYDPAGKLLRWGPMSGGKAYCRDLGRPCRTPPGRFTIYRMQGAGCVSKKFPLGKGGARMPYCMFYRGGYAIHGSYEVPGHHASHGCVRIFVEDAAWLYREFVTVGETQVWIDQAPPHRRFSDRRLGWQRALRAPPCLRPPAAMDPCPRSRIG